MHAGHVGVAATDERGGQGRVFLATQQALADRQEGQWKEAAADLWRALRDGAEPATAHYDLALARLAAHDGAAACRHLDAAPAADPKHAEARALRERPSH